MRLRIVKFILILNLFLASAQKETFPVKIDSIVSKISSKNADSILNNSYQTNNKVGNRKFRENFRAKYQGKDFDYTVVKPHESLWEKFKRMLNNFFEWLFGDVKGDNVNKYTNIVLRILAIIAIAVVLYFIVNYLLKKEGNLFFSKRNKKVNILAEDIHENIHEINFQQKISEAENHKDYRLAIRYRFLEVLKKLSDKSIIDWHPEKTNQDYLVEIKQDTLKQKFQNLVWVFDYVWYGEFSVTENDYRVFTKKFQETAV